MTCIDARDAMLTAEPADLQGDGDSELALHLRTCESCRVHAAAILYHTAALDDNLVALVRSNAESATTATSHTAVVPRRKTHAYMRAAAVLACVAVAGGLLKHEMTSHTNEIQPLRFPARAPLSMPRVNGKAAGDVAVMRTNNPSITVIWYLSPRRGKS